jgi:hypothetical protein
MNFFPQLSTGCVSQFPLSKRLVRRTIQTVSTDGRELKLADPEAAAVEWELRYTSLSQDEWMALDNLHRNVEGRLATFTFLDPTSNLLAWSEDFEAGVWSKGPLLQITTGISDPLGTNRAVRITNLAQVSQSLSQVIHAPGWYQYVFSVSVRSNSGDSLFLIRESGGLADRVEVRTSGSWSRSFCHGSLMSSAEQIRFGVELEPGASVEVFGLQVEPQLHPSTYKRTLGQSGVFPRTRFVDDRLSVIAHSDGLYACLLRLRSSLTEV